MSAARDWMAESACEPMALREARKAVFASRVRLAPEGSEGFVGGGVLEDGAGSEAEVGEVGKEGDVGVAMTLVPK